VNRIVYRPYLAADEPGLRELFRAVYGSDAGRRTSAWRYLAPAPYPAAIQIAEANGRIVGAQPSHAIDLLIDGVPVRGLLMLDVMTHPEYRRRGVFAGVVEGLRERAATEGYRVLLTTPNRDAERRFARLPAWRRMGELVPWVFPGDPATLLAGRSAWRGILAPLAALRRILVGKRNARSISINENFPGSPALDAMWPGASRVARCQVVRDARFIEWRFGAGSGRPYKLLSVEETSAPGALIITCAGDLLGREVTFIADIVASDSGHEAARKVLRAVAMRAIEEQRAAAVGWFAPSSAAARCLHSAGFRPIPKWLRPRPYAVWGWTNLPVPNIPLLIDLAEWHMTLADSDLA
jgi:GNAT superfamily N-acetyltransferase